MKEFELRHRTRPINNIRNRNAYRALHPKATNAHTHQQGIKERNTHASSVAEIFRRNCGVTKRHKYMQKQECSFSQNHLEIPTFAFLRK